MPQDLRYAARQIRRAPGPTALIVVTLALGLGVNVTMAGAIDRLLFRAPPHIERPDRVARIVARTLTPSGHVRAGPGMSYPALLDLRSHVDEFELLAGFSEGQVVDSDGGEGMPLRSVLVTPEYFRVLGVRPAIGRFFGPDDGFPSGTAGGGPPLAVLGYGFWQSRYGGDRAVLGRGIQLDSLTYTIVGVAPKNFRGVGVQEPDLWLPLSVAYGASPYAFILADAGAAMVAGIARLRPVASRSAAAARATSLWSARYARSTPRTGESELLLEPVVAGRGIDRPFELRVLGWLGGLSVLVLLIACANVANLLIARAYTRRREVAVRLAMGAGVGRLARQLLTEAMLLAALAAAAAVAIAAAGGRMIPALLVEGFPSESGSFVDARLVLYAAAVGLGTAVLISLVPLLQSGAPDLTNALRASPAAGGGRTSRARAGLLTMQSALCVLLLIVAGVFTQSLRRVEGIDLGADVERTIVARFSMRHLAIPAAELREGYAQIVARVRAIPGVMDAALAAPDPFGGGGRAVAIHTPETDRHDLDARMLKLDKVTMMIAVDSGFFRTTGARVRGRDFESTDVVGAERVAIISEPLARVVFPDGNPLGKCVYLPVMASGPSGACHAVIGVLPGFWYRSITDRDALVVFVPLAQRPIVDARPSALVVQTRGDPTIVMTAVRRAILAIRPDIPFVRLERLTDLADPQMRPWRLAATMFSLFGGLALVIAIVGLYAVVSFAASQRSTEIAVRVALGARRRDVVRTIASDGLPPVAIGIVAGVGAALAIASSIAPLLFQTTPDDPFVVGRSAAVLLAVALLALLVPTARALRQNPASALRSD